MKIPLIDARKKCHHGVFKERPGSANTTTVTPGLRFLKQCQNAAVARLIPQRIATNSMERYCCSKCNEEYFMKNVPITGPPPGPHSCPECGGELHWTRTEFGWIPNSYDMD